MANGSWRNGNRSTRIRSSAAFGVCVVGHKTEESLRRVPFPAAVLPYLPQTIKAPLFPRTAKDPADAASKRLNRFLDDIGIDDRAKVIHSFGTVHKIACGPPSARRTSVGRC